MILDALIHPIVQAPMAPRPVTGVAEARLAGEAGADALVVQGWEAEVTSRHSSTSTKPRA